MSGGSDGRADRTANRGRRRAPGARGRGRRAGRSRTATRRGRRRSTRQAAPRYRGRPAGQLGPPRPCRSLEVRAEHDGHVRTARREHVQPVPEGVVGRPVVDQDEAPRRRCRTRRPHRVAVEAGGLLVTRHDERGRSIRSRRPRATHRPHRQTRKDDATAGETPTEPPRLQSERARDQVSSCGGLLDHAADASGFRLE